MAERMPAQSELGTATRYKTGQPGPPHGGTHKAERALHPSIPALLFQRYSTFKS